MFPADLETNANFFKDNYYEVTDLFKQTVKTDIVDPIVAQLAAIKEPGNGKSKAMLVTMDVVTSC